MSDKLAGNGSSPDPKFRVFLEAAPDAIVVVNSDGEIVMTNKLTEKMFGYSRTEMHGKKIEILVPEQFKKKHSTYQGQYAANPKTRSNGTDQTLSGRKKDGTEFPVEISLSPFVTEHGTLTTSIIRDITERRRAEIKMKATLLEKEALIKEIHHRVKNNLQVTSSLLRLQSENIRDEHARELFVESQNRIRSMALVHEKLYKSSNLSRVNFLEYLNSLAQLLFRSFGVDPEQIQLEIKGNVVLLSIDTAVPCGLIVNELLSNSLKHAFPNGKKGKICISTQSDSGSTIVKVFDDGIGLPKNFNFENSETLGLQLVHTLVKQINGEIELDLCRGTCVQFKFQDSQRFNA